MTRFLSEALQAAEPFFRQGLRRLEAANGRPATDIRLTTDITRNTRAKLMQLGLDPDDTTPKELYQALQQRVAQDDRRLTRHLQTQAATHVSAEADVVAGMVHVLKQLPGSRRSFALKTSVLKGLLRQNPPKKAMKRLGYRSLDSLLKHEAPVSILAAAWLAEGPTWQHRLLDQYKKLRPADFENRSITLLHPKNARWQKLAAEAVTANKHNLLCFKELGALVFLPLPKGTPPGAVTASLSLALHELNEIRAAASFLKLCQVRADFGQQVHTVATDEARLNSQLLDQPVAWNLIQRYYARLNERWQHELFEPHLQLDDMVWEPVERSLSAILPELKFWQGTAHLSLLHQGQPVSLNVIDAALNVCNRLPFEKRLAHYSQRSLWNELQLRYMHHQPVENSLLAELQPQLAEETVSV